jgi:hypothetical protein
MRIVTAEEALAAEEKVFAMDEEETFEMMTQLMEEQPFIQAYIIATLQTEIEEEDDENALASIASIVWVAMREVAGGCWSQVTGEQLEAAEEKLNQLLQYAEGEPAEDWGELVETLLAGFNQRPLMEYVVKDLADPENPYGVSEDGLGIIFSTLNVIINCLDDVTCE